MKVLFSRYFLPLIGIIISLVSIFWLANQFDFFELIETLKSASIGFLLAIPILTLISFLLRAERWRILISHTPPIRYWSSFSALMIGYLLNNILPARAGDIARVMEIGKTEHISRTKVLATLFTERAFDLLVTLMILAAAMLTYPDLPQWVKDSGILVAIVSFTALILMFTLYTRGLQWTDKLIDMFGHLVPAAANQRINNMLLASIEGIETIFNRKCAFGFLMLTGLIWLVEVLIVYSTAASLNIPLAFGNALFVLLILSIGLMIPSSPGFIGTYEFFGITALSLIGFQGELSLSFVLLLHIITLLSSTSIGVICLLTRK